jgi:hypothetical protein
VREQFLSPSGYYIVVAPDVSGECWYVRVLDFATWKHRRDEFDTESAARREADRWRL